MNITRRARRYDDAIAEINRATDSWKAATDRLRAEHETDTTHAHKLVQPELRGRATRSAA